MRDETRDETRAMALALALALATGRVARARDARRRYRRFSREVGDETW
jgi:hypothetical protein